MLFKIIHVINNEDDVIAYQSLPSASFSIMVLVVIFHCSSLLPYPSRTRAPAGCRHRRCPLEKTTPSRYRGGRWDVALGDSHCLPRAAGGPCKGPVVLAKKCEGANTGLCDSIPPVALRLCFRGGGAGLVLSWRGGIFTYQRRPDASTSASKTPNRLFLLGCL